MSAVRGRVREEGTMFIVLTVLFVFAGGYSCEEFKVRTATLSPGQAADDTTRIIGGSVTTIDKYPYTVQVIESNQLVCGGSLLTRRHVLTAAHCFFDDYGNFKPARLFRIRVGTSTSNSGGSLYPISAIVIHERYNQPLRDNDVAVVVLTSSVTLTSLVREALVPVQGAVVPVNASVWHVGWGVTNTAFPQGSRNLMEVQIRTINEGVCRSRYQHLESITGQPFPVTSNMICAGLLDVGGKDACQGDSGGPLIYQGMVVGVTSWGYGCADPFFPGVSARVASYTTWLEQTVARYNAGCISTPSFVVLLATLTTLVILNTI